MIPLFKAASVQYNPMLNERDKNIDQLIKVVEVAAKNGAKLVVTPELATTGYHYGSREEIRPFVDTIPGHTTERFSHLCRKHGIYVVIGMAEEDDMTGLYYNSAALIGPAGWIGTYRKLHLWELEAHWAVPGDLGVPVFPTELGNIAINICMDSIPFESARLAAVNGADILAFPTNSTAQSISLLQARAETNGMYVISANRSNTENGYHMIGASAIWSPTGKKLAESPFVPTSQEDIDQPTIIYADIEPALYKNKAKVRLRERRVDLYKDLLLHISPWNFRKTATSRVLAVTAIQYEPVTLDKQANLAKMKQLLSQAAEKMADQPTEARLAVLPELSLTGPVSEASAEELIALAEPADGPSIETLKQLAKAYQCAIVFGFLEVADHCFYNSAMLVNSDGIVEGIYRQTHVRPEDKKWATPGDDLPVFDSSELGKIGILIGYDMLFPETAGLLAVGRADVIAIPACFRADFAQPILIHPHISKNPYPTDAHAILEAISISSQAYTVMANFTGTAEQFAGRSGVYTLDPLYGLDQPIVASADHEEAVLTACQTIQQDWWFQQEKLIALRRTDAYKPLLQHK